MRNIEKRGVDEIDFRELQAARDGSHHVGNSCQE